MERLKRAIESEVGRDIERLVERRTSASGLDELLERLAPSDTWRRFRRRYILATVDADYNCNSRFNGYSRILPPSSARSIRPDHLTRRFSVDMVIADAKDDHSLTSIGSISSVSTTDTVIVFGDVEILHVCELLVNDDNISKLQGLDMLARASNAENFIRSEEWGMLEKLLKSCLFIDNSLIRSEVTCIYRAMICSSDDRTSLTAYSSLLGAVCNLVCRGKEVSNVDRLRQAIYLLDCINDYHKECIAHRWLRTPTHIVAAFVRTTLEGLADDRVWTLLAGVDPTAGWLQGWLAAAPVRAVVMAEIRAKSLFLRIAVSRIADDRAQKTVLLYSCCVLLHFLRYEEGRQVIDLAVGTDHANSWFTVLINCVKIVFQFQPDPSLKDLYLQTVSAVSPFLTVNHLCELIHLSVGLFPRKVQTDTHLEQFDWATSFLLTLVKSPSSRHVVVQSFIKDHIGSENLFQVFRSSFTLNNVHVSLSTPVFYLGLRKTVQACSHIVAHPLFLLHYHLSNVASLVLDVLSLDTVLPRGFVVRMSLTSIGRALWRRGVLEQNAPRILNDLCRFEGRVSETLMITNFIDFVPPTQLTVILDKVGMHIWKRHASDDARLEALLCIYAPCRNVEIILECVVENSVIDRNLFRDVLLLPANKRLTEDQLIMSLTVLSVICSSLPSFIYIQKRFRLIEALRHELLNHIGDQDQYVADEVSNHVDSLISRVTLVGGHSERLISGFNASGQLKPARKAIISIARTCRMNKDMSINLRYFDELIQGQGKFNRFQFEELFSLVPEQEIRHVDVLPLNDENIGLQLLLTYNKYLQLIDKTNKDLNMAWAQVQANAVAITGSHRTFDFWLASLFLLCRGNVGRTLMLQSRLIESGSHFVSFPFVDFPGYSGDVLVAATTCQAFELIIFKEFPQVYFALRRANYLIRNVVSFWVGQAFWNVLNMDEIATLLAISIVYGTDHIVYICAAIVRHLQNDIIRWSLEGTLGLKLRLEPVVDFKYSDHLEFCHGLRKVYRKLIQDAIECNKH
ncbi:uncharacterized protein LOC111264410 [Varroa jacobsoni]|uniref:uncharacterized protein LOC111264410 n=1 Tax=Varroa jacobsoni TaxID=62625 RepID=UPI000BF4B795|nr:uncharacterized protein LOC111264410 [Varroa jacobsoni]